MILRKNIDSTQYAEEYTPYYLALTLYHISLA
jgi:hypothetical protein